MIERVLGLDPSLSATGWAVVSADGAMPTWGHHKVKVVDGAAMLRFGEVLDDLCLRYRVEAVCYETVPFVRGHKRSFSTERPKFALEAIILYTAAKWGLRCDRIELDAWRMDFIGTARAPAVLRTMKGKGGMSAGRDWLKRAAIDECARRGWMVSGDDEAEALGIACYGLARLNPDYAARMAGPLTRYPRAAADARA